ncbi:acyl-CoA dehydrogenase family protein [Mycobacterium sp. WMMD1722]|uniref:acyl-CoA dehydrogenase family protein n=1 Tax=Mycobacterium sp. WMMD1722 TaxID=3404117 RepID=UPI003BF5D471
MDELHRLVDDLGRQSFDARMGRRTRPETLDTQLLRHLEETGLSRLTSAEGAGPAESAVVLAGLARHGAAVPVAETDVLAGWLAGRAGFEVSTGALTVAVGSAEINAGRLACVARDVPWPQDTTILLAAQDAEHVYVAVLDDPPVTLSHNLAGEPRGTVTIDVPVGDCSTLDLALADELMLRGAWARCVQTVGALDAAAELTVAHTRTREQFGRPLSRFQAVQHALAAMAGEIERARAVTDLAVAATVDHGFDSPAAEYAITTAKVTVGGAVEPVTTIAHQLHGAIGVTAEHPLWLFTMRARSWVDEFGTTAHHAGILGRRALTAADPWDVVVGPRSH